MTTTTRRTRVIVVGVDATEQSGFAAAWAASTAAELCVPLIVVHALDHHPGASESSVAKRGELGAALLGRVAGRLASRHPELRISTMLSIQSPDRALTELSLDAEFVVTGTRGYGGIAGVLLRSVSSALAMHAHCPTVIVRGPQPAATKSELVLGLRRDEDPAPIDFAFRTAAALGLEVRAARAFLPASSDDGCYVDDVEVGRRDTLIGIGSLLRQTREQYPDVSVGCEAECGDPRKILSAASRDARLLVIGGRRWRAGLAPRLGPVASDLLTRPGTPVAVVPER